jgi:predicted dehydrogenase
MDELRIGVVGAGAFATFALEHLIAVDGVGVVAVADVDAGRADAMAQHFGVAHLDVDAIVGDPDAGIDIVYIATPPASHGPLTLAALGAGRHVLVEKPLAIDLGEADAVVAAAEERGSFAVANLLQRYNPVADQVRRIVNGGVLGEPLHAFLENWAADEGLAPTHWFWDRSLSGGIFVEHVVHFFDLFASWFGAGEVVAAERLLRPGSAFEEQVRCTTRYRAAQGEGVLVDQYHGFHQPGVLDRMQLQVLFERGDVALSGWIPTEMRIDAIADERSLAELMSLIADAEVVSSVAIDAPTGIVRGRHHDIRADRRVVLRSGRKELKMQRYGELVRALFADQVAWAGDRSHRRRLDERASRDAVALAVAAAERSIASVASATPS